MSRKVGELVRVVVKYVETGFYVAWEDLTPRVLEFLIDTVELVSIFLIRNFESRHDRTASESLINTLDYWEAEEFNESWDDSFSEFIMGDYSYPASEIWFNVDKQAYVNEFKAFTEAEE